MARPVYALDHSELAAFSAEAEEFRSAHSCEDILLVLVTEGKVMHYHPLRTDILRAGDVAAVAPGEVHWLENRGGMYYLVMVTSGMGRHQLLAMNESESFVDTRVMAYDFLLHQYDRMEVIHLDGRNTRRVEEICRQMVEEEDGGSPGGAIVERSLFTALLVHLCRAWREQFGEQMAFASDKSGLITDVVKYISENYQHAISIESLANQCFISSDYFRKLFKQNMGEAPLKYINRVRTEKAAELLESGSLSVTEVAALTGFNDINNFTRIFKHAYGATPSEYRKRHMDRL